MLIKKSLTCDNGKKNDVKGLKSNIFDANILYFLPLNNDKNI